MHVVGTGNAPLTRGASDGCGLRGGSTFGGAIGLTYQGGTYQYYFGVADVASGKCMGPLTIMELGSLAKTFTAALLAMAYNTNPRLPAQNPTQWIDTLGAPVTWLVLNAFRHPFRHRSHLPPTA